MVLRVNSEFGLSGCEQHNIYIAPHKTTGQVGVKMFRSEVMCVVDMYTNILAKQLNV